MGVALQSENLNGIGGIRLINGLEIKSADKGIGIAQVIPLDADALKKRRALARANTQANAVGCRCVKKRR
eukprot:4252938-Amphidinium_carterae.1